MSDSPVTALVLRPGLSEKNKPPETPGEYPVPQRYSQALHVDIVRCIQRGNNPPAAASACGLPRGEFNAWISMVREGRAPAPIRQFVEDCDRAYDGAEVHIVERIYEASTDLDNPNLDIALKYLERSRAKDWSKTEKLLVQGEIDGIIGKLEAKLPPELFTQVIKILSE